MSRLIKLRYMLKAICLRLGLRLLLEPPCRRWENSLLRIELREEYWVGTSRLWLLSRRGY